MNSVFEPGHLFLEPMRRRRLVRWAVELPLMPPFIQDPRGMATVGIVGLVLCFAVWGLGLGSLFGKVMLVLGVGTLGLGIASALVGAEGSELLLAIFIGAAVIVWAIETMHDAGLFGTGAHAR